MALPPAHCETEPSAPRIENETLPVGTPCPWVTLAVSVSGWPAAAGVALTFVTVALPLPPPSPAETAGAAITAVATNARTAPMPAT
jgi:hypothetical protein